MQASQRPVFATTQWSLILQAGNQSAPEAERALAELCEAYWFPLYAFARRHGYSREDAADRTQEFFSRLIEQSLLETANKERGRFRTFLLTLFQRFLAKEYHKDRAIKRGGRLARIPFDIEEGESRLAAQLSDQMTAERVFEQEWALTVLRRAVERLRDNTGWMAVMPGSWRVFDDLEARTTERIDATFGEWVVETLRRELEDQLAGLQPASLFDSAEPAAFGDSIARLRAAAGLLARQETLLARASQDWQNAEEGGPLDPAIEQLLRRVHDIRLLGPEAAARQRAQAQASLVIQRPGAAGRPAVPVRPQAPAPNARWDGEAARATPASSGHSRAGATRP